MKQPEIALYQNSLAFYFTAFILFFFFLQAEFRLHPKQRKLDIGSQEEIANLLSMEPDKKLLREKLMQITGKVILMKDIHNIKTRLLNPKTKAKESRKDAVEKDDGGIVDVQSGTEIKLVETLEMETQTEGDQDTQEIHIPVSHVASSHHLDTSHHQSIMIQQPEQQIDSNVQQCYMDSPAYQQHPPSIYSGNLQPFQPAQVYSMTPQPFQQTSANIAGGDIVHGMEQINPSMGNSHHFQHWTTLSDVGHHNLQETTYQTLTSYPYHEHQNSTPPGHQEQQPQHHLIPVPNSQPMQPSLGENMVPSQAQQQGQELQFQPGSKRTKRRREQTNRGKKKKRSVVQTDKDTLMKKYFQQATVNLFFNERLKSPGKLF